MKLIVGLGNPGRKYEQTRHNVGFMAAAKLAALISADPSRIKFEGELAEGNAGGQKLIVLCPHTFMNASGQSVRKAIEFYKICTDDLLVLCDDFNLATGRLRIRRSGSAGGQNGLKDIIRQLDTEAFARLRIGIGKAPPQWSVTDYVLGKFSKNEQQTMAAATTRAAYAAIEWATNGVGAAMNQYNADPDAETNSTTNQDKQRSSGNVKPGADHQRPPARDQTRPADLHQRQVDSTSDTTNNHPNS